MGCFWGWRDNNSYADTTITASDGTSYKYGTVFTEKTTKGEGIACSSYANCYIGCSCNTSNGWYSSCQGSDCKSATDNHYTGVNSLSAGKSISDVASISASAAATAGATSGISTLASGATTCYKKKTCEEGGYYDSVPAGKKCPEVAYNGYTCYDTNCTNACPDGYFDTRPTLDATQSKYMEIHENNDGCFTIWCKSPATNLECATAPGSIINCGKVLASYDNLKCYEGVGLFEIVLDNYENGDPHWGFELYTNGGDVGDYKITATVSGNCQIRGQYNGNIAGCPSGSFDYLQPCTSKTRSWSTGTSAGGGYIEMPEIYEILQTLPQCLEIFGSAEFYGMSDVTVNAESNNPNIEVTTRIGW